MQDDFRRPQSGGFRSVQQPPAHMPLAEPPAQNTHHHHPSPPPVKKGGRRPFHRLKEWYHHLSKKQKIILWGVLAGLLIASVAIWWFVIRNPEAPPTKEPVKKVKKEAPKPTTVASRLTGVQIPPELNNLPTTGIMIENSPDARPQSGLFDAGVVFEAIAEGGITRFLSLYMETSPDYIGPVRSVRPYYLDFLVPFDAPIAHAGGSAAALAQIREQGIKDLDHGANPNAYQRISSRFAPHNLYTDRNKLLAIQNAKGWNTSTFTGFARKEKEDPTPDPSAARSIDLRLSSALYNVHYDYDAATNRYLRTMGGQPHIDEKANQQIAPKAVVALVMSHHYGGIYSIYGTSGGGQVFVFQDGRVHAGTWEKANRQTQFTFKDANGNPLKLTPGQTWLTLVSAPDAVTYQP